MFFSNFLFSTSYFLFPTPYSPLVEQDIEIERNIVRTYYSNIFSPEKVEKNDPKVVRIVSSNKSKSGKLVRSYNSNHDFP